MKYIAVMIFALMIEGCATAVPHHENVHISLLCDKRFRPDGSVYYRCDGKTQLRVTISY